MVKCYKEVKRAGILTGVPTVMINQRKSLGDLHEIQCNGW